MNSIPFALLTDASLPASPCVSALLLAPGYPALTPECVSDAGRFATI